MIYRRVIPTLMALGVPLCGCSADWYARNADREVARIAEERKERTLGYKPQTQAKSTVSPEPIKQAYEKIPMTAIAGMVQSPLEPLGLNWKPVPLGPAVPGPQDDNYDFVPLAYSSYGVSMEPMGPPLPGSEYVALDLMRSIEYAVTHAREYQSRMEDLYLSTLDVTLQRHLFEPTPFANTTVAFTGNQAGPSAVAVTPYQSALAVVNTAGVKQQLPYGGEIVARQLVTFTQGLNDNTQDGQAADTALSATIPLLKGAGMVNLEPLVSSERQLVYTVREFENYRRQFSVNISANFFSLVSQQQGIKNRRQNYVNLKLLSERSISLYAASRLKFLDVQRALQNQLTAEAQLIDSINAYQASLDSFKITLGMSVQADLEIIAVELQLNMPDLEAIDAVEAATRFRLDLQTVKDRVDDARRNVKNAKNGLLPNVELTGTTGVGNLSGSRYDRYTSAAEYYTAGISIDWPVDQLADRNTYRKSLIILERSQRAYVTARQQVIADVRQSTRSIRLSQASVAIQRRSVELNQKRLDLANELLIQGKAAVLDVVDAQAALLNAQDALNRARANLQTQALQFLRDTGTLRLDPGAGMLGRAMDRAAVEVKNGQMFDQMERRMEQLERQ